MVRRTTGDDEGAPLLCSSHYNKNLYKKLFHDQQENFTGISGKGKKRRVKREECISFKSVAR